ncbi:MAG TPA: T9SS type A sorting domain-containing protein, partial [Chitinophagales bacterium]
NHNESQINAVMNDTVKFIFRQDILDSFQTDSNYYLHAILADNDVYKWVPQSPVRMYFCTQDEKVPYHNAYVAYAYFKGHGATTEIDTIDTGAFDHVSCAEPSLINAKFWIDGMRDMPITVDESVQQPSSSTSSDGSVSLTVTGGKAPVNVLWNNGVSGTTLNNVSAGDYSYTITDSFGCEKAGTISLGVSGISELSKTQIRLYPSPANDVITIETTTNFTEKTALQIFNMLGQKVLETTLQSNKQNIDVSKFSSGIYTCKLNNGFVQSFVKN